MAIFIEEKNEKITATCFRYGIKRLFVLGSALRDDFRPGESDIDLLFEFGPLEVTRLFHSCLEAREAFRQILQTDKDLVIQDVAKNKIILEEIDRTRRILYGS
jgi:predicted nucleotidyltransferase